METSSIGTVPPAGKTVAHLGRKEARCINMLIFPGVVHMNGKRPGGEPGHNLDERHKISRSKRASSNLGEI